MKVTPEHLELLRAAITPLDTPARRLDYLDGNFPRADKVKVLDERYRWDLYWASGVKLPRGQYATAHIDTALRALVPKLDRDSAAKELLSELLDEPAAEKQPDSVSREALRAAHSAFTELQSRHRSLGADDTEPRGHMNRILADVADGRAPRIPNSAREWELFADKPGAEEAAAALSTAARRLAVVASDARSDARTLSETGVAPSGEPRTCPRHGGPWGGDETCSTCVDADGDPRPYDPAPLLPLSVQLGSEWMRLDDEPFDNGSGVGGDGSGDAVCVRWARNNGDGTFAVVTSSYYDVDTSDRDFSVDDSNLRRFAVECQTEFLVCTDPDEPVDTEITSDYVYSEIGGECAPYTEEQAAALADNVARAESKRADADGLFDWDGRSAVNPRSARAGFPSPVSDAVTCVPITPGGADPVKFGFRDGQPVKVSVLSPNMTWGDPRSTAAGVGAKILRLAQTTSFEDRKAPAGLAREFAASTGRCLLCGRTLSDPVSAARGYGPECASKVR